VARSRPQHANILERRTLIVWGLLIVSLSMVSGLLFALDPTPHAPAVGPVLTVLDPSPGDLDGLINTRQPVAKERWDSIVICHSGQSHGSAETLSRAHQSQGLGGLAFHFVVGNGDGAYDGEIQAGYRWSRQLDGAVRAQTISICLIGNADRTRPTQDQMEQLTRLVTSLQKKFGIPAERVYLHRELAQTTSPGLLFDAPRFRKHLRD
jgi:hypothetical protein